jgi:hypothetical protein
MGRNRREYCYLSSREQRQIKEERITTIWLVADEFAGLHRLPLCEPIHHVSRQVFIYLTFLRSYPPLIQTVDGTTALLDNCFYTRADIPVRNRRIPPGYNLTIPSTIGHQLASTAPAETAVW